MPTRVINIPRPTLVTLYGPEPPEQYVSLRSSQFYKEPEPDCYTSIKTQPYNMIEALNKPWSCDFKFVSDLGRQATLIAPNIAIASRHHHNWPGDVIGFDGHVTRVVSREYAQQVYPSQYMADLDDYVFLTLEDEMPVTPCRVVADKWYDYDRYNFKCVPTYVINHRGEVIKAKIRSTQTINKPMQMGDSGSPVFLMLDGDPILIGVIRATSNTNSAFVNISYLPDGIGRGWKKPIAGKIIDKLELKK